MKRCWEKSANVLAPDAAEMAPGKNLAAFLRVRCRQSPCVHVRLGAGLRAAPAPALPDLPPRLGYLARHAAPQRPPHHQDKDDSEDDVQVGPDVRQTCPKFRNDLQPHAFTQRKTLLQLSQDGRGVAHIILAT